MDKPPIDFDEPEPPYEKEKVCAAYWTAVHCVHSAYKDDPDAATWSPEEIEK